MFVRQRRCDHVSELAEFRVDHAEDISKPNDEITANVSLWMKRDADVQVFVPRCAKPVEIPLFGVVWYHWILGENVSGWMFTISSCGSQQR
jgi:hypothetical protein